MAWRISGEQDLKCNIANFPQHQIKWDVMFEALPDELLLTVLSVYTICTALEPNFQGQQHWRGETKLYFSIYLYNQDETVNDNMSMSVGVREVNLQVASSYLIKFKPCIIVTRSCPIYACHNVNHDFGGYLRE